MTILDVEATIRRLKAGHLEAVITPNKKKGTPETIVPLCAGHINTLTRACLIAPPGKLLAVADFSQVEARALAWAAQDHDALARFALYDGGDKVNGDPYRAMGARIYGGKPGDYDKESPERATGKAAELACGYGQGGGHACPRSSKYPHGYNGFLGYVLKEGGSWDQIIATMGGGLEKEEASKLIVDAWREQHAPIVHFWRELQAAAVEATEGGPGTASSAGPFTFLNVEGLVLCELPSGRALCYHGMRTDPDEYGRPSLSYVGRKGRERTYGGKLTENVIQAMCRDLLAEVIIRAEAAGLAPVHTIHDEPICEVPADDGADALALLVDIMHVVPAWAAGMPIAAEGLPLATRYGK